MKNKSHYHEQIRRIKELGTLNFKVDFEKAEVFLRPVDESDETIHLVTEWRNKYGHVFNTKFEATIERTRKYIRNQMIANPDRILFMIILNNQKIGHLGMFQYNEVDNTAHIDNVLRGIRKNYPGLMEKVLRSLLKWAFEELKLCGVLLTVFEDNTKAIDLYQKCNMQRVGSIPCRQIPTEDGWKWEETQLKIGGSLITKNKDIMQITKEEYFSSVRKGK